MKWMDGLKKFPSFWGGFLAGAVFFERTVINLADILLAIEHSNSCYDARLFRVGLGPSGVTKSKAWGVYMPVICVHIIVYDMYMLYRIVYIYIVLNMYIQYSQNKYIYI